MDEKFFFMGSEVACRRVMELLHFFLQYLAGCTQYFATTSTDKYISENSKSRGHLSNKRLRDPILDDYMGFKLLDQALSRIGFSDSAKVELYAIVAAVLHLGNVTFEDIPNAEHDGCQVSTSSENALIFVFER